MPPRIGEAVGKVVPNVPDVPVERINPDGPIRDVPSWSDFNTDLATGLEAVGRG